MAPSRGSRVTIAWQDLLLSGERTASCTQLSTDWKSDQYPQLALPLFVWRCGKWRRSVFDDRLPMVKAGGQRTATDNGRNDNDTVTHD